MADRYLRLAALGDSATVGVGDRVPGGWRGWSRLLVDGLRAHQQVSVCTTAVCGATAAAVRRDQLATAVAHRPDLATLVVGVNDTMRSGWDSARVRDDVLACAAALDEAGARLLVLRFHDHAALVGLPGRLGRVLAARLEVVNRAYDEVVVRHGALCLDLAGRPELLQRASWSVDRLHPSERGHRALARAAAELLAAHGYAVRLPGLEPDGGVPPSWGRDVAWVVGEGAPWLGRRARDLAPVAVRAAVDALPRRVGANQRRLDLDHPDESAHMCADSAGWGRAF